MPRSFLQATLVKTSLCLAALTALPSAFAADRVFFESPADGATVTSPLKVKFGLEGMKIAPLGDMTANTGHHHLIINGQVIKAGETGLLVTAGDEQELAEAIIKLLENEELRANCIANAKELILKEHTPNVYMERLGDIYRELV